MAFGLRTITNAVTHPAGLSRGRGGWLGAGVGGLTGVGLPAGAYIGAGGKEQAMAHGAGKGALVGGFTGIGPSTGAAIGAIGSGKQYGATPLSPAAGMTDVNKAYGGIQEPTFTSMIDPATGQLRSQYQFDPTKSMAFNKLNEEAMATPGQSPWAKMQLQSQMAQEQQAKDEAARSALQSTNAAESNLARMGGLGSGQRTQLAKSGIWNLMGAKNAITGQGVQQRLGIGEEDINRQQGLLGQVANTENTAQESNLGALRGEVPAEREFNMQKYLQQMGAKGAAATANAQIAAANANRPKSGFLGLGTGFGL